MSYRLIVASAHDTGLKAGSVHLIVTSSPYFNLRQYSGGQVIEWPEVSYSPIAGMPEITIKGYDPACVHEWVDGKTIQVGRNDNGNNIQGAGGHYPNGGPKKVQTTQGACCIHCGGWRGGLGSEGTIEAFIGHLVLVLREMHRVLRDDGICFFNLGDSYTGSGGAHTHDHANPGISNSAHRDGATQCRKDGGRGKDKKISGLPAKNLMMVPARFALAAQADGWIVRSAMPWIKRNGLPESAEDRPGQTIESVFMLVKGEKYYFDMTAVQQPVASIQTGKAATFKRTDSKRGVPIVPGQGYGTHREDREDKDLYESGMRNLRAADLFFKTWEGMLLDDCGDPMAMVINPKGFSGSHFACFPPELPEMAILCGTSEKGCCPICQAPWRRCVEKPFMGDGNPYSYEERRVVGNKMALSGRQLAEWKRQNLDVTTGWAQSCSCPPHAPIPAVVLDPFVGSGTTCQVAQWLGRDSIGLDLSDEYHALAHERINTPRERAEDKRAPSDGQIGLFEEFAL